jgi:hypothetical protein
MSRSRAVPAGVQARGKGLTEEPVTRKGEKVSVWNKEVGLPHSFHVLLA